MNHEVARSAMSSPGAIRSAGILITIPPHKGPGHAPPSTSTTATRTRRNRPRSKKSGVYPPYTAAIGALTDGNTLHQSRGQSESEFRAAPAISLDHIGGGAGPARLKAVGADRGIDRS